MPMRFGALKLNNEQCTCGYLAVFVLLLTLPISCQYGSSVYYSNGQKITSTYTAHPRHSTVYTERGKRVYTDSVTGRRVKVIKYKTVISCWGSTSKKRIQITYDSAGKRISRENLLR